MTSDKFNEVINDQIQMCKDILCVKAEEYATQDRLHNFKTAAEMQCTTYQEALAGMMAKHTISIYDMCRSKKEYPIDLWNEKITDHINYLLLLKAIVVEKEDIKEDMKQSEMWDMGSFINGYCANPENRINSGNNGGI